MQNQNKLVTWLDRQKGERSIRTLAKDIGFSHAYVADVLKGSKPVTWNFAAAVASGMNIDHLEAFRLAGLLPNETGDTPGGASPISEKVTIGSVAHKNNVVTNGAA